MKAQEAIKALKQQLASDKEILNTVGKLCGKESKIYREGKELLEADRLAIYALRKLIPEQVNGNPEYYTCKCGAIVPPMERYCQDCGQRLKWRAE